jgi:hypothetical protein
MLVNVVLILVLDACIADFTLLCTPNRISQSESGSDSACESGFRFRVQSKVKSAIDRGKEGGLGEALRFFITTGPTITVCVCFFVLCNRHWFSRVPGANLRIA